MKTKIKIKAIALIIGLLCWNSIYAQPREGHKPPPIPDAEQINKIVDEMEKTLSLTATQKQEIKQMYIEHFNKVKLLHDEHKQHREKLKKDHEKLRTEFETQIEAILYDGQKYDFSKFIESHKPQDKPQDNK